LLEPFAPRLQVEKHIGKGLQNEFCQNLTFLVNPVFSGRTQGEGHTSSAEVRQLKIFLHLHAAVDVAPKFLKECIARIPATTA
jgi:hypothetical protein